MECSEKPIFHNYTRQELAQIRITAPEEAVRSLVKKHWDTLAKPLDGMAALKPLRRRSELYWERNRSTFGKKVC